MLDEQRIKGMWREHFKEFPSEKENQGEQVQEQEYIERENDTEAENKEIDEQPPALEEITIIAKKLENNKVHGVTE